MLFGRNRVLLVLLLHAAIKCASAEPLPYLYERQISLLPPEERKKADILRFEDKGFRNAIIEFERNTLTDAIDSINRSNAATGFGRHVPARVLLVPSGSNVANSSDLSQIVLEHIICEMLSGGKCWIIDKRSNRYAKTINVLPLIMLVRKTDAVEVGKMFTFGDGATFFAFQWTTCVMP